MSRGGVFLTQRGDLFLAKMTQSSTNAPAIGSAVINDLGVTPTPARTSAGLYTITATGKFTVGKTFARVAPSAARHPHIVYTSVDVITIQFNDLATPSAADSGDFDLEIFVAD